MQPPPNFTGQLQGFNLDHLVKELKVRVRCLGCRTGTDGRSCRRSDRRSSGVVFGLYKTVGKKPVLELLKHNRGSGQHLLFLTKAGTGFNLTRRLAHTCSILYP